MDALALRTLASTLCGHLGLDELFVPDKHISEMYGVFVFHALHATFNYFVMIVS